MEGLQERASPEPSLTDEETFAKVWGCHMCEALMRAVSRAVVFGPGAQFLAEGVVVVCVLRDFVCVDEVSYGAEAVGHVVVRAAGPCLGKVRSSEGVMYVAARVLFAS